MHKKCLLWLLSSVAVAQVPRLSGKELIGQPQLSALLDWTSVPNAPYSVYRAQNVYGRCPASYKESWIEIASGLSVTLNAAWFDLAPMLPVTTATAGSA